MNKFAVGDFGHLFVITSFITSIVATYAFFQSAQNKELHNPWATFARITFYLHGAAVIGVVASLFIIIYKHHYEYHYAWSHSSNSLPVYYMISCFWEGQEGSFLLWIFWHVVLGTILITVNRTWTAPVMAVFCFVQVFLSSMIIGVVLPYLNIKIGSSPFILLKDFMGNIPVYKLNRDYVPADGTGLNPLLQNYWMVIHPPTLFLGFATTLVPFSYCIAGLWKQRFREWIRPALPWALFSAAVLGVGILMGGYWAYETLNFGGYWNWDPVENAVYVPWLVLVAAIHTMIIFRNSEAALKSAIILVIATFLLILYSTFLTRSGILGSSSVHSFTDLGLSGQLLIYLLVFLFISIYFCIVSWKKIPSSEEEASIYSREFWIFIGATVLCLAAFQVIATTSIPVYKAILEKLNIDTNIAPPVKQEEHYSNWQIWFAILIAILSGLGQYFWWKRVDGQKLWNTLAIPLLISLLASFAVIHFAELDKPSYILLVTASVFTVIANAGIFIQVVKNNYKLSGGAVAHIGVGLMLIGILFSSGYSKIISLNNSGLLYSKEFPMEMNRDNILLWRNDTEKMNNFDLTYKGSRVEAKGFPGYVPKEKILQMDKDYQAIAKDDIYYQDEVYFKKGDTITIYPENTFYEVQFKNGDETFTLYPRAQVNPQMGLIASPAIKRFFTKDLYCHVSSIPAPDAERKWSKPEEYTIKIGDTLYLNDYIAILDGVKKVSFIPGVKLSPDDAAVTADFRLLGKEEYHVKPAYMILVKDKIVGQVPETVEDLGLKITFLHIDPAAGKFTFSVNTTQKDYIILKAIEKPMINVLWIGTLLLVVGLILAITRRYSEFIKMRDKGIE